MGPRESQQGNLFGNRSPLPSRVKIVLVTVSIILCAGVTPCECQNDQLSSGKQKEDTMSISESPPTKLPSHIPSCKGRTAPKDGTCNVAHLFDSSFLLVANYDNILHVQLNGENNIAVSTTIGVNGLDHDCAEGRFYWNNYNTNQFFSAKYDGTDQKLFIEKGIKEAGIIAVDWISRRLYWVDRDKRTIEVASLENPNVRTVLIYENVYPWAIAVDPLRNKLYWWNFLNNTTIEWSNLDGTNRQVLLSHPQISDISSITVSTATGELCYVEQGKQQIRCIDPLRKQIRIIASNLTMPEELVVTDEMTYWTDRNSNAIESINMNGVRQKPIPLPNMDSSSSTVLTAVSDKCPLRYSPCANNNGECPENTICLVNPSAVAGKSCIVRKKCKGEDLCDEIILDN